MTNSQPIHLTPDMIVDIEGKKFTVAELKEHVIDSVLYRKHLEELMAKTEEE